MSRSGLRSIFHSVIVFLLAIGTGYGQSGGPTEAELSTFYDQLNAYRTARYAPLPELEALRLPATFSGADVRALHLQERHIVRIDLVYTAFHLSPTFDQRQLNLSRIRNLAALLPGLLQDETVTWTLVEQTGCNSPAECQPFFHGFVVYVAPHHTAASRRAEVDSLKSKLRRLEKKHPKAARKAPGKKVACNFPRTRGSNRQMARALRRAYRCPTRTPHLVKFRMEVDARGRTRSLRVLGAGEGVCVAELEAALRSTVQFASGIFINHRQLPFRADGAVRLPLGPLQLLGRPDVGFTRFSLPDSAARLYRLALKKKKRRDYCEARITTAGELLADADTTSQEEPLPEDANVVARVMRRHPEWDKQVVVADVTGSMYPYTYDLLAWLQLSVLQDQRTFVFFNDGNDQPDKEKRVGKTGGLFHVKADSYEPIKAKVLAAMTAGGGGDAPENDAEALLYARQLSSDSAAVILIADNYTFPRDAKLLKHTAGPVRIILCGVQDYINPKYLALARRYGYSLHTIEADILDLSKLLEGETITIQGQLYQVTRDGFKLVRKT